MYRFIGDSREPIHNVGMENVHVKTLRDKAGVAENVVDLNIVRTSSGSKE